MRLRHWILGDLYFKNILYINTVAVTGFHSAPLSHLICSYVYLLHRLLERCYPRLLRASFRFHFLL